MFANMGLNFIKILKEKKDRTIEGMIIDKTYEKKKYL